MVAKFAFKYVDFLPVCVSLEQLNSKAGNYDKKFQLLKENNLQCTYSEEDFSEIRILGLESELPGFIFQFLDIFKTSLKVRLMGGRIPEEGRVEVKIGNSDWGVICGDSWSLLEAMVVCKALGLNYASNAAQTNFFGGNASNMILSGVNCRGNESRLDHCMITDPFTTECPGNRDQIAGVVCTNVLPDLIIDTDELERSAYLEDKQLYFLQCAMEENCLASSAYSIQRNKKGNWHMQTRRLLRFTAKITNIGNTAFRPFIPKHLWEFHQCHMHYHSMEIFATFDVLDQTGVRVAEGHKASFCLEDNQCTSGASPSFACANYGDQGISVNCSDIYRHHIDCQWVDISELNPGIYTFKVSINPEFKVAEMTFANNVAICTMYYAETFVRIYNCYVQHP
ncbi:lysyl oxidase homolog 2A-like isoform X2 [Planococcus citri]|uniref:lysyl oxidase homolog 2A-like isoform X2 n=1 Tax=Planococcus citri TaxID=170843 RepID=UPI0031F86510